MKTVKVRIAGAGCRGDSSGQGGECAMTTFRLTESQQTKASDFINSRRADNTGATGGQFTYQFTPTTIGLVVVVIDNLSKDECDLSDYKGW